MNNSPELQAPSPDSFIPGAPPTTPELGPAGLRAAGPLARGPAAHRSHPEETAGDVPAEPKEPPQLDDRQAYLSWLQQILPLHPGTLVVLDSFHGAASLGVPGAFAVVEHFSAGRSHGKSVADAARQTGFSGPLLEQHTAGIDGDPAWVWKAKTAERDWTRAKSPAAVREALTEWAVADRIRVLRPKRERLELLEEGGLRSSVVNLSAGHHVGQQLRRLWDDLGQPENTQRLVQLAGAFNVDEHKLLGSQPGPRNAAMAELLGALHNHLEAAATQPLLQAELTAYQDVVARLVTEGNNSVVVAAGNEGELARPWVLGRGAETAVWHLPQNSLHNDLCTPLTVNVGALERSGNEWKVANYSSAFPAVNFYADGRHGLQKGTSFAAPRVAAALAGLHAQFPHQTSPDIQARATQQLSSPAPEPLAPQLDPDLTRGFLLRKPDASLSAGSEKG